METAGPALALAISPSSADGGKREVRGEVLGMATSSRLCEVAAGPLVAEASRSVIATGRSTDDVELDRGSRGVVLGPVVIDVAFGRGGYCRRRPGLQGMRSQYGLGNDGGQCQRRGSRCHSADGVEREEPSASLHRREPKDWHRTTGGGACSQR